MSLAPFQYRGRFAPSPTGPLHFGSLIAALASFLEARTQKGTWLVRIDDVDETRIQIDAADNILFTLENYGFEWDESVLYQTKYKQAYAYALEQLSDQNLIYRCTCSRKQLREQAKQGDYGFIYPSTCQHQHHSSHLEHALRIKTHNDIIEFNDTVMGHYSQQLKKEIGDFVIRRRDHFFAYQLAVVVDDEFQNISHVVRGYDLLDSTPRQIYLQQCLNYRPLNYTHLPIAVNDQGDKLSKQTGAQSLPQKTDLSCMIDGMNFLGQNMPVELKKASIYTFWQWAFESWDTDKIPRQAHIQL